MSNPSVIYTIPVPFSSKTFVPVHNISRHPQNPQHTEKEMKKEKRKQCTNETCCTNRDTLTKTDMLTLQILKKYTRHDFAIGVSILHSLGAWMRVKVTIKEN